MGALPLAAPMPRCGSSNGRGRGRGRSAPAQHHRSALSVAWAAELLALALALALGRAGAQCTGNTYSYGSAACAPCATGATFISSAAGCAPSATLTAGPVDTALFLSGSQLEGVAAFPVVVGGSEQAVSYAADAFGMAGGALVLASGSYLAAAGVGAPPTLPTGLGAEWSTSAWVKCPPPLETKYRFTGTAALDWGAPEAAPNQAAALDVGASRGALGTVSFLSGRNGRNYGDGPGSSARFHYPQGLALIASSGVVVVADRDNHRVRLISPSGYTTTLAGGGAGFADGAREVAQFRSLTGVAVIQSSGDVIVADNNNHRIRLVTPLGYTTTLAGNGAAGFIDGTGTNARFEGPNSVQVLQESGVVIVFSSSCLRFITPIGVVSTFVGRCGTAGFADGWGSSALLNGGFVSIFPATGDYALSDGGRIRLVTRAGLVTTLAGGPLSFYADGTGTAAGFQGLNHNTIVPLSNLIIAVDFAAQNIRQITPLGLVTTVAGSTRGYSDGTNAHFYNPTGVVAISSSLIAVTDNANDCIRLINLPPVLNACDGTWHHVAMTYSPTATPFSLSAFLDGALVLQRNNSIVLPAPVNSTLRIGWGGAVPSQNGSMYNGSLSNLRIYARALTSAEVVALSQPLLPAYADSIHAVVTPSMPTAATLAYVTSCTSGFSGPTVTQAKSSVDGTWGPSLPASTTVSFTACAASS